MSTRLASLLAFGLVCFGASSCGSGGGGSSASKVSAPASGSFWAGTKTIRWSPLGGGGGVVIELSNDGGSSWGAVVTNDTPDDGAYGWDTSAHADGGTHRVRVRKNGKAALVSGLFTLDNTAPAVALTAPTGGELWGGSRDVTWTTIEANPDFADIIASDDSGLLFDIPVGVATPDDGLHSWDTSSQADGTQYQMQILVTDKAGNQSGLISSGNDFELDNTAPVVNLNSPMGGEDWDQARPITWTTTDLNPGTVDISLSINSGGSYDQTVVDGAPDTGSYLWQTGYAPDGSAMRVQVNAIDGAGNVSAPDSSAGDFTITNLRLLAPIHYQDTNANARIDAGDELYLLFDKDIVVNGADVGDLALAVTGDLFGAGASLAAGPELRSVVVTLGASPTLRTRGDFSAGVLAALSPGGLDIAVGMTPDAIEHVGTGRDAAPSGPKDLTPGFVTLGALAAGVDTPSRGAIGDLDGDGHADMVIGSTGGAADVRYMGDGAGGWTSAQSFGAADTQDLALGDVDGDGDLDVVIAASGSNRVWINDGSGALADSGQALGAGDSRALVLIDADRDGDLDAVFGNGSGQANTVWTNNGAGVFAGSGQSLGNGSTHALVAGDLDGDGDLDLVCGNWASQSRVWINTGGTFSPGDSTVLTQVHDVALGDLNGDGDLDAFYAVLGQNEVQLGDGAGNFASTSEYLGNNDHRGVCLIDLDGDGDLDAVTAKYLDSERYWINDGTGQFSEDPRRGEPDDSTDVLCGRVDGDSDTDLVLVNDLQEHRTYLASLSGGQPAATFNDTGASHGPWRSGKASSGDVNGDGRVDVLVPDRAGQTHVLLGNGAGGLTPGASFGPADARGGRLFDADQDGDLDYLQWLGDPGAASDRLWLNDGSGDFSDSGLTLGLDTLLAGDLDGDGDVDLIAVGASEFEVWDGDGAGGFSASGQTGATSGLAFWGCADLDHDGDPDLVYGRTGDTQVWSNDGAGNFTLAATITPGGTSAALAMADYDGDGDDDLMFGTSLGLAVVRNDGALSFSNQGVTGPNADLSQVLPVDTNEDGYVDFLVLDGTVSSYYLCIGDGTASLPGPTGTVLSNLAWGLPLDLDGDGDLDMYWSLDDSLTPAAAADRVDLFE